MFFSPYRKGSATQARVQISNTSNAQSLQDLAAERCSMPYRAPELFNVEAHCIIDERTDIWVCIAINRIIFLTQRLIFFFFFF